MQPMVHEILTDHYTFQEQIYFQ